MTTTSRVWLITGASRGLGRAFAEAALAAGDRVAAISRTPAPLGGDSLGIAADVTDRAAVLAEVRGDRLRDPERAEEVELHRRAGLVLAELLDGP